MTSNTTIFRLLEKWQNKKKKNLEVRKVFNAFIVNEAWKFDKVYKISLHYKFA